MMRAYGQNIATNLESNGWIGDDKLVLDRLAVKVIVDKMAKSNSSITYGEMARAVERLRGRAMSAQGFAYSLGRIQDYCLALGLPCLPVMAVGSDQKPAGGFIEHYHEIHPEAVDASDFDIIRQERRNCLECREWQVLYDYVGLNEQVPEIRALLAEHLSGPVYKEGKRVEGVLSKEIERNPQARMRCLALKGHRCIVCEKDIEEVYGVSGIVHVHHLRPIADYEGEHEVDPMKDLVPVCPTCHAVIHSKGPRECYTPNEVRGMLGFPPLKEY